MLKHPRVDFGYHPIRASLADDLKDVVPKRGRDSDRKPRVWGGNPEIRGLGSETLSGSRQVSLTLPRCDHQDHAPRPPKGVFGRSTTRLGSPAVAEKRSTTKSWKLTLASAVIPGIPPRTASVAQRRMSTSVESNRMGFGRSPFWPCHVMLRTASPSTNWA